MELAEKIGVVGSTISNIKKGKNSREKTIERLAQALGSTKDWVMHGTPSNNGKITIDQSTTAAKIHELIVSGVMSPQSQKLVLSLARELTDDTVRGR